jgi:Leucine-rich repeat (LRR) protein
MYLPKEIGKLENVKVLFFNYNKIKFIPKSYNKLENLKFISLINNPIDIENELLKDKIIVDVTKLCSLIYSNSFI